MNERYIALAIPFFLALITVEFVVARAQRRPYYRFHDAVGSLSCGIGQQILALALALIGLWAYTWAHAHIALLDIAPSSPLAWIALILLVDLSYYSAHRADHRVNILWAGHAVHHQSEEYNLTTALRQSALEPLFHVAFYLPLAIIGYSPEMVLTGIAVNTLYQFWIHTRTIGRLGFLEGILNTPSSHRVHHGVNPLYIDRNFGGMFMLWDRALGTYQPETEEPIYGTVKPLASFSPLWANASEWARLWTMSRATHRLRDKLLLWVGPPEWRPADLGGPAVVPEVDHASYRPYDLVAPRWLDAYVATQLVAVVIVTTALLWAHTDIPLSDVLVGSLWVIAGIIAWSGLFESRTWALALELARHLGGAIWLFTTRAPAPGWASVTILAIVALSAAWLIIGTSRRPAVARDQTA